MVVRKVEKGDKVLFWCNRWVEWSYNTSWNSSSGLSPYEITFGKKPFNFLQYLVGDSNVDVVDTMLKDREAVFT